MSLWILWSGPVELPHTGTSSMREGMNFTKNLEIAV
jgi:hypothetical protein